MANQLITYLFTSFLFFFSFKLAFAQHQPCIKSLFSILEYKSESYVALSHKELGSSIDTIHVT